MTSSASHSGRRNFNTKTARLPIKIKDPLRNVQEPAGHAARRTSQRYIQGDRAIRRNVLNLI